MEKQLTQQEALQILIGAAQKGNYSLQEADMVFKAIKVFTVPPTPPVEQAEQTTPEVQ
jgi:hypothetical protein